MGYGSYSRDAMDSLTSSRTSVPTSTIFTSTATRSPAPTVSSAKLTVRECCDSPAHPESFPLVVALDVTGSMGRIPEKLAREKLKELLSLLIDHKVADPAVCFCAIGDAYTDRFPFQAGQFEHDGLLADKHLTALYLEKGGGGQHKESYSLAWYFAANYTQTDAWFKRNQKGFLFTIGDEGNHQKLLGEHLKEIFNLSEASDITDEQLLAEASRRWHIFHIHCQDGSYRFSDTKPHTSSFGLPPEKEIETYWRNLLGERLLVLDNSDNVAELIAATVGVIYGADVKTMAKSMTSSAAASVSTALATLNTSSALVKQTTGIITL